jgi:hypothetical protein
MLRLWPSVDSPGLARTDRRGGVWSLKLLAANWASRSLGRARGERGGVAYRPGDASGWRSGDLGGIRDGECGARMPSEVRVREDLGRMGRMERKRETRFWVYGRASPGAPSAGFTSQAGW